MQDIKFYLLVLNIRIVLPTSLLNGTYLVKLINFQ
jgi:hypothetical protein